MRVVFAPALSTASATVSKTGTPSTSWPPLPGRHAGDEVRPVRAVAQAVEAALAAGQTLDDEPRVVVDDDRHYFVPLRTSVGSGIQPSTTRSPSSSRTRAASSPVQSTRASHGSISSGRVKWRCSAIVEPGELEEALPLGHAVVAHVARVAQAVGLLRRLADEGVVADHDAAAGDARHLLHRREDVGEVMRGEPARDRVEAPVRERQALGGRGRVGAHSGRGIGRDDGRAGLAQAPRDVSAAGGDVEDGDAGPWLAPLDDEVEILAGRVDRARAVRVGALRPEVGHAASSTARRAPSSIVASG